MRRFLLTGLVVTALAQQTAHAQALYQPRDIKQAFAKQTRAADGRPGPKYWQQRCDYDIVCELDEPNRKLTGKETITYFNNSPDPLTYLWIQLDENQHSAKNNSGYQSSSLMNESRSFDWTAS